MIDLFLIAVLAQAPPPPPEPTPGGDRRDGISTEVLTRPGADHSHRTNDLGVTNIMTNFSDPEILKHLESMLGTVRQGLCQARSAVSGIDSNLYDSIDKALNLSAATQREAIAKRFAAALRYRLDTMYHQSEVTER